MPAKSAPPAQSYLDKIKEMYPDEFHDTPLTLKKQLHEMDQIIAVEENYLSNPDINIAHAEEEEFANLRLRKKVFQGRREGQELNFDRQDYRQLSEIEDED